MNDQNDHDFAGEDIKAAVANWSPNRRRFLSVAGLAVGGAVVGTTAAGCGTAQTGNSTGSGADAKGRAGAAGETLFVAGFQWGPPTSFNPFAPSPAWPTAGGQSQLIYESLLRFNLLDGSLTGGLAKEIQQPDASTFVLPLQDGTKWSDGSELTADDVAFTFDLAKQTALVLLDDLELRRQHRGHGRPDDHHQDQGRSVQPGLRQERAGGHLHRAQGVLEQGRCGQGHRRHQPDSRSDPVRSSSTRATRPRST